MLQASDLMLSLDSESLGVLRTIADRLGCDYVEADSADSLSAVLAVRRPTIAVIAIDNVNYDGLAALRALAQHGGRPATLLIGSAHARVLAGARRAAESLGLPVIGVVARPLDAVAAELILTPFVSVAPPIPVDELEQALVEQELTLQYQLKVAIGAENPTIQGVEALVRWQHPRRGLLQPHQFLGAVEEYGLMTRLTDFVMTEAVRQVGQWRDRGLHLEMVVNLSPRLVTDCAFPERLAVLLREHEVPAQQLVLDVTESPSTIDRDLLLNVFTRLRILGIGLSLDNFGTGLSSLTELYRLPFSEIKVDHSLIADTQRESEAKVIVQAIIDLAHALQLNVCAEGIETRQMLEFVRAAGCDTAQGRFFSGPVPAASIERLIQSWPSAGPAATGSWRPIKLYGVDNLLVSDGPRRAGPLELRAEK